MKKNFALLVGLLLVVPGCSWKKWGKKKDEKINEETFNQVDFPLTEDEEFEVADDTVRSFFDEDEEFREIDEFVALDDESDEIMEEAPEGVAVAVDAGAQDEVLELDAQEFAWQQEDESDAFSTVYFDFDRYGVRADQEEVVAQDIDRAVKVLTEKEEAGQAPKIVVEGHACHSAGSAVYNLAISERRAKSVADRLVASGVSRENIKVVGRGAEMPAVIEGEQVTGGRAEQWANRRVELHTVYS